MRERPASTLRASIPRRACTVDVVVFTPRGRSLAVLVRRGARAWAGTPLLPWVELRTGDRLEEVARGLVREAAGLEAAWLEQVGAFADGLAHPAGCPISVCFVAVVPPSGDPRADEEWLEPSAARGMPERQVRMLEAAQAALRMRMDTAPIPFRLLPARFTLSELQAIYEMLVGRRLHKASFRRALHASWLVEPTDEWRSEGRGRPAQLFRYAPRRRRARRRAVRFDLQ
jgi:8-oxo-dGTP diphosphatase